MYMHVCIHIYTEVVDRIAQLSAIASHICRRSISPISDRFAVPCAHTRVMLSLTHVHRQILVQGRDRAMGRFLYIAFLVAMETQRLDTQKLIGLKRVSYNGARSVLDAMPYEMRAELNVDSKRKFNRAVKKARTEVLEGIKMEIELPLHDGKTYTWVLARPQDLLRKLIAISPALMSVLRSLGVDNSYSNPLSIVHYNDGITSGNLLAPVHSRSFTAFRFTIKEFGKWLLTCQQWWFEFAILRNSVLLKVVGGMAYVWKTLMHIFFTSTESFRTVGLHIDDLGDGPTCLFCQNKNLIADKEASEDSFDLKGSSGMVCCLKCKNCIKKNVLTGTDYPMPNPHGLIKDVTHPTLDGFVPNTNEAIFKNVDELQRLSHLYKAKAITKENFELAEMSCGINHNPHGPLQDEELRPHCQPLDMHTEDWAHIYLSNGVGDDELGLCLSRMKAIDVKYDQVREELELWKFPRHYSGGKGVWRLFSEKREKANGDGWKSGMSEFLALYPIFLDWISKKVERSLPGEVESFRRLCAVLDYLQDLKHGRAGDAGRLHALIEAHLHQHKLVYGSAHWKPKWHSTLHLAGQYKRDRVLFDTIQNERNHQTPKSFGDIVKDLNIFEEYVLARSVAHQITELRKFQLSPCLEGETTWNSRLGAFTAASMSCQGLHIAVGDYVLSREGSIVEVQLCGCKEDGNLFLLGDVCLTKDRSATSLVVLRRQSLLLMWVRDNQDVKCARCWKPHSKSGELRVIV